MYVGHQFLKNMKRRHHSYAIRAFYNTAITYKLVYRICTNPKDYQIRLVLAVGDLT